MPGRVSLTLELKRASSLPRELRSAWDFALLGAEPEHVSIGRGTSRCCACSCEQASIGRDASSCAEPALMCWLCSDMIVPRHQAESQRVPVRRDRGNGHDTQTPRGFKRVDLADDLCGRPMF